jgi:hypothetical protein
LLHCSSDALLIGLNRGPRLAIKLYDFMQAYRRDTDIYPQST